MSSIDDVNHKDGGNESNLESQNDNQENGGKTETLKDPSLDMAKGLESFLKPVVIECDLRIKEVFASQIHLSNQINALNEELSKFSEISKIPALGPYVNKLANARGRVNNVNLLLDRISQRLARIQASLNESR